MQRGAPGAPGSFNPLRFRSGSFRTTAGWMLLGSSRRLRSRGRGVRKPRARKDVSCSSPSPRSRPGTGTRRGTHAPVPRRCRHRRDARRRAAPGGAGAGGRDLHPAQRADGDPPPGPQPAAGHDQHLVLGRREGRGAGADRLRPPVRAPDVHGNRTACRATSSTCSWSRAAAPTTPRPARTAPTTISWGPSSLLPTLLWLDADRLEGLGQGDDGGEARPAAQRRAQRAAPELREPPVRRGRADHPRGALPARAPLPPPGDRQPRGPRRPRRWRTSRPSSRRSTSRPTPAWWWPATSSRSRRRSSSCRRSAPSRPRPCPAHASAPPVVLEREVRRLVTDKVNYPRLVLVWPAPAGLPRRRRRDGPRRRHPRRRRVGPAVRAAGARRPARPGRPGPTTTPASSASEFRIEVTAAEGVDLERIKRDRSLEELERLKTDGPTAAEVVRVKAASEASFLRRKENLRARADMLNAFYRTYGRPDSFARDLARRLGADRGRPPGSGRGASSARAASTCASCRRARSRPPPWTRVPRTCPRASARPVEIRSLTLANGIPLHVVSRPGSGLFTGTLLVDGGERLVPAGKAGLAALTATLLTRGAGGRDATAFADAVASLGAVRRGGRLVARRERVRSPGSPPASGRRSTCSRTPCCARPWPRPTSRARRTSPSPPSAPAPTSPTRSPAWCRASCCSAGTTRAAARAEGYAETVGAPGATRRDRLAAAPGQPGQRDAGVRRRRLAGGAEGRARRPPRRVEGHGGEGRGAAGAAGPARRRRAAGARPPAAGAAVGARDDPPGRRGRRDHPHGARHARRRCSAAPSPAG